jgi:hypothetical protein
VPSGNYYLVARLDPEGVIADTDATNDVAVSSSFVLVENTSEVVPDLTVEDIYVLPDRAFPTLTDLTRGFVLRNKGGVDALEVITETYLSRGDDNLDDDDTLVATSDPVRVDRRSRVDVGPDKIVLMDEITPPMDGEVEVHVIVRAIVRDAGLEDGNPDDNTVAAPDPIVVSDELADGPDIVVRDFEVTSPSAFLGGTLQIGATIANEGTLDVSTFFCAVRLSEESRPNPEMSQLLNNVIISSLNSGDEISVMESLDIPGLITPGEYFVSIECDPRAALDETFRSNNTLVYDQRVTITDQADIDMYVDAVTLPGSVPEGQPFDVVATICVDGSNPSGPTTAALYRNTGARVTFGSEPTTTFPVPNINPGACEDVSVEVDADCEQFRSDYYYGVEVDAGSNVPETDEGNNTLSSSTATTFEGRFCSCEEDNFRPNFSLQGAEPITEGSYDAAVCRIGSCDYYSVTLQGGDSLIVRTDFEADRGLLETSLVGADGVSQIDSSDRPVNQQVEVFDVDAGAGGDAWTVKVCGTPSGPRNYYSLDVDVIEQATTVDVIPHDLQLPVRDSFPIGSGVDLSFTVHNVGQVTSAPFQAVAILTQNDQIGDADDVVLDTIDIGAVTPGSPGRSVQATVDLPLTVMDGDYFIAVDLDPSGDLADDDPSNNLTLSDTLTVRTECFDPLEPNEDFSEASTIQDGTFSNLVACESSPDFYKLCVDDGKQFSVSASFTDANGDIDMKLYDSRNTEIAESASSNTDVETVSVDYVNGAQCFWIEVYMLGVPNQPPVENDYSLDVSVQDVPDALQCSGYAEPNDNFAQASSYVEATRRTNALDRCPVADADYYRLDLVDGQTVDLEATFDPTNQGGELWMELYNPFQTFERSAATAPGLPTASIESFTASQTGTHYVKITINSNERNATYRLSVSGLSTLDLLVDDFNIIDTPYAPGDAVPFDFTLFNLGTQGLMSAADYDLYLGTSATPDPGNDLKLGSTRQTPTLGANDSVDLSGQVVLPSAGDIPAGSLYLHVVVDPAQTTADVDFTNNSGSLPITVN